MRNIPALEEVEATSAYACSSFRTVIDQIRLFSCRWKIKMLVRTLISWEMNWINTEKNKREKQNIPHGFRAKDASFDACSEDANIYILNYIASKIHFHMLLCELVNWGRSLTLEALLFSTWSRKNQTNLHIIRKRSSASMLVLPTPHFSADSPSSSHLTMLRASRAPMKFLNLQPEKIYFKTFCLFNERNACIWQKAPGNMA